MDETLLFYTDTLYIHTFSSPVFFFRFQQFHRFGLHSNRIIRWWFTIPLLCYRSDGIEGQQYPHSVSELLELRNALACPAQSSIVLLVGDIADEIV